MHAVRGVVSTGLGLLTHAPPAPGAPPFPEPAPPLPPLPVPPVTEVLPPITSGPSPALPIGALPPAALALPALPAGGSLVFELQARTPEMPKNKPKLRKKGEADKAKRFHSSVPRHGGGTAAQ